MTREQLKSVRVKYSFLEELPNIYFFPSNRIFGMLDFLEKEYFSSVDHYHQLFYLHRSGSHLSNSACFTDWLIVIVDYHNSGQTFFIKFFIGVSNLLQHLYSQSSFDAQVRLRSLQKAVIAQSRAPLYPRWVVLPVRGPSNVPPMPSR